MEMNRTHKKLYKAGKLWVSVTLLMGVFLLTPTPIAKATSVAQSNANIVKTNVTNAKKYAVSAKQEAAKATAAKNATNSAITNANKAYTAETNSYNVIASAKKSAGKYVGKATVANIKAAKTLATTATNANKIVASNYKTIVTANTTATSQAKKATVAAKNATSAAKKAKSKTSTNLAKSATTSVNAAKSSATTASKANSAASKAANTVKATTSKAALVSKNASAAVKYIQSVAAQPISSAAAPSTPVTDEDADQARIEAENKVIREGQIGNLQKAGATAAQINTYTSSYTMWMMAHNLYMYSGNMVTGLDGQRWLMVYKMNTYYFIDPSGNDLGANPYTATGLQIKTYSDNFAGNKARMIIDTDNNYYLMVTLKDGSNRYITDNGTITSTAPHTSDDLNIVSDVTAKASTQLQSATIYSQLKSVQTGSVINSTTNQKQPGYLKLTFNGSNQQVAGYTSRYTFGSQGFWGNDLIVYVSPNGELSTNQKFTADNSAKPTDKQQNIIDAFNRLNSTNLQATK